MKTERYQELFQKNVVLTMDMLKLETRQPRESILRDLKGVGYYSSYNERGKYYILSTTPKFDNLGLWKYQDAFFSIRRTLLNTAEYLINNSDAGYTHEEMRWILGIGIQNTLNQLTKANKIERQQFGAWYVYYGKGTKCKQQEKRNAMPVEISVRRTMKVPSGAQGHPNIESSLVIEILVAVLRGNETESAAHNYLRQIGTQITAQQVSNVFRYYGIGKKNFPDRK